MSGSPAVLRSALAKALHLQDTDLHYHGVVRHHVGMAAQTEIETWTHIDRVPIHDHDHGRDPALGRPDAVVLDPIHHGHLQEHHHHDAADVEEGEVVGQEVIEGATVHQYAEVEGAAEVEVEEEGDLRATTVIVGVREVEVGAGVGRGMVESRVGVGRGMAEGGDDLDTHSRIHCYSVFVLCSMDFRLKVSGISVGALMNHMFSMEACQHKLMVFGRALTIIPLCIMILFLAIVTKGQGSRRSGTICVKTCRKSTVVIASTWNYLFAKRSAGQQPPSFRTIAKQSPLNTQFTSILRLPNNKSRSLYISLTSTNQLQININHVLARCVTLFILLCSSGRRLSLLM